MNAPPRIDRLVIATRGSALALWQAAHTKARLQAVQPGLAVELRVLTTQGDLILDRPLAKVGGKGLFVKEIEAALLDERPEHRADLAVHSMKDLPADLADGLVLAAVSSRESPWDALLSNVAADLEALPTGARVGTSSMRRQCQLLARRPDLRIEMLRGNVPTRVAKLDAGQYEAIVLAAAGLQRLGLGHRITQVLPIDVCLPAVAQGVLALETRLGDTAVIDLIRRAIHDPREAARVTAERAFLLRMGGSCQTPLAAHAVYVGPTEGDDRLVVRALCGMPDGSRILHARVAGAAGAATALGVELAEQLLGQGADEILRTTALQ